MEMPMRSERRWRARQIFEQAIEMPEAERTSFLDRACGEDETLKRAVRRLLRADAEAGDFLRKPLVRAAPETPPQPPDRVGPYQLREKIGEGGMGAVYRAVRDDQAFDREVAVKLIVHSAISDETHRRLGVERQILATLDHPWIAQIFDGGTTDGGLPYLVMELVDGVPIDVYCEREKLSIRERIELFRKVCAAVHCSHQNLVVHCDLKPSNILVTAAGAPKLLDFGIAKLLSQDALDGSSQPTTVGSRPLTPEYASPEQIQGQALSTVSDVYSLGVLLYKLLTGQRPNPPGHSARAPQDTEDVTVPSVAAAQHAPGVARALRGDLDHIVLKALRTAPTARYGSAEQMAEDLERHLGGLPVRARHGSWRYRTRKFLRRHRTSVAAAATGIAVLMAFAVSMAIMASRLSREQAKLQQVSDFYRGFFELAGPLVAAGHSLTLREAVDKNTEMIENGLVGQPAVKVEIVTVLSDIYRLLGQAEKAHSYSEQALTLHRRLTGEDSQDYALGLVRRGAARRDLGRYDQSENDMRAGLAPLQARSDTEPRWLVWSLNHLVSLLCWQGRYEDAADDSAAALRLAEAHLDKASLETLVATTNRGLVERQLGRAPEAERLYERALNHYRHSFPSPHPYVAPLLNNLGLLQRDRGDLARASRTIAEANSQYVEMFGTAYHGRIRPLMALAQIAAQQQRVDDAVAFYREAIDTAMQSPEEPKALLQYVLRPTVELGELLLDSGRCHKGEQLLRDILQHSQPWADESWRLAEIEGILGQCLAEQLEDPVAARPLLESSYARLQAQADVDPDILRRALQRLNTLRETVGEAPLFDHILDVSETVGP